MIKIERKNGESIDSMLKRYKRRTKETKLINECKDRREYEKPSVTKRRTKLKAAYIQEKKRAEEKDS
jgi:small subunit ribosomal protein S21